jgi:hypothetical protein
MHGILSRIGQWFSAGYDWLLGDDPPAQPEGGPYAPVIERFNGLHIRWVDKAAIAYIDRRRIVETVSAAADVLRIPVRSILVTVIPAVCFGQSEEEALTGPGRYEQGIQHILLAGLKPTTLSDREWVIDLRETIIHELCHQRQELDGELKPYPDSEPACDELVEEVYLTLYGPAAAMERKAVFAELIRRAKESEVNDSQTV